MSVSTAMSSPITSIAPKLRCRFCQHGVSRTFVDLGMSPLCESYLASDQLNQMEPFYPLHALVCEHCWLVQLDQYVAPGHIFSEYAYFSSYSDSWLRHASAYVDMAASRFGLGSGHLVAEIASNDGYLLQYFVAKNIPVLGIEPAANVAKVAQEKGVNTVVRFFGVETARALVSEGRSADLIVANNVLAHVPDINDFVEGIRVLLKPGAVATLEFPHLLRLIEEVQYDTIYHEHFSYLSLSTVDRIMRAHGLLVFDVEELKSHGGSLRVFVRHAGDSTKPETAALVALKRRELDYGLERAETYTAFADRVMRSKRSLLEMLIRLRNEGHTVAGYGAPGKGNTLLNYCGIRQDLLEFTVDRNPYKHGRFLPGTHIPIYDVDQIAARRPDYIVILPWNLKDEIVKQLAYARDWGARFIVPIPEAHII